MEREQISYSMPHIARFAEEAGMNYVGLNDSGQLEFMGTTEQQRVFHEMIFADERNY